LPPVLSYALHHSEKRNLQGKSNTTTNTESSEKEVIAADLIEI